MHEKCEKHSRSVCEDVQKQLKWVGDVEKYIFSGAKIALPVLDYVVKFFYTNLYDYLQSSLTRGSLINLWQLLHYN